jgi:ADP-ribose pyrophosphatase YjhB (NUDIX family)
MTSIKKSAGLVILYNNKILLGHPTNQQWFNSYTIPKGNIEDNESTLVAAIRECKEEIGLLIDKSDIDETTLNCIDYHNKNNKLYKKVYYYVVYLDNIESEIIDKSKLQLEEIDWAGFLTKEEAKERIFWRFEKLLDLLDEV